MAYQLTEINEKIRADVGAFLAESDAAFEEKVAQTADRIAGNMQNSPVVLLSGPSGSGKTTTALKLERALTRRGIHTHAVSLDDYFKTQVPEKMPRTPDGEIDYESPLLLDTPLLDAHFTALAAGREIIVPHFEFARRMRNDSRGRPLRLAKDEVAIFEGIHALNPDLSGRHPEACRLYISARSDVLDGGALCFKRTWMRLTRRAVRDYNFRGTDASETLAMWANVRRGEKLYISPYKHTAHVMLDSSLPYEVSVMRNYALPMLRAVPQENQRRSELLELIAAFDAFEPIDPVLLDPDSLLREFIGGSSYYG